MDSNSYRQRLNKVTQYEQTHNNGATSRITLRALGPGRVSAIDDHYRSEAYSRASQKESFRLQCVSLLIDTSEKAADGIKWHSHILTATNWAFRAYKDPAGAIHDLPC